MNLLEIASSRRATKAYNGKKVSQSDLKYIFEVTNTAPTSIGLEQWRVISFRDDVIKQKLGKFFKFNKDRFLKSSDALVFITKQKEWFKPGNKVLQSKINRMIKAIEQEFGTKTSINELYEREKFIYETDHGWNNHNLTEWSKRQAYIASAFTMLAAKEIGINSTPVEGFDYKLNEQLIKMNLMKEDEVISLVVLLGYSDGLKHSTYGKKQLREEVKDKFKII